MGVALCVSGCSTRRAEESLYIEIQGEVQRGQLNVALQDADEANKKYPGMQPETAWRFRVQKAHILFLRGSYRDSLQLLDEDLPPPLARSEVAGRRELVRGLAHTYLQQFKEADQDLSAAAEIAQSFRLNHLSVDVSQARGILELYRGKYADAAVAFRGTLEVARQQNLSSAELRALGNLGNVAMWEEHYDEAIDWFKLALEKSQALREADTEAKTLGNIGWNYLVVGNFDSAEDKLLQAEKASVKAGLPGDQVKWLNELTGVYFQQRRYDVAGPNSEEALRLARKVGDNRDITNCLNSASDVALATGHDKVAEKYNEEALGIEQAGLDQFGVRSSTIIAGRIAASKRQYRDAEKAFQRVIRDSGLETPQRWEAQADLAEVHAAMGHTALAEREFGESVNTITKAWNALQHEEFRLSFLSSAIRFYDAYVNFLIEQKRPLDALKVADRSRAQTLEHGLSPKGDAASDMAATLRPQEIAHRENATLLFYWLGEQRSHLWVITPTKVSLLPLPGRSEMDAHVKSYMDAFPEPRDPLETGNADGKKLYEMLIEPAEKLIPKNSRVLILPDGGLNSLNFETLIVPGDKPHYWIEDVTLSTGNSLALLAKASSAAPPADASLFLMGDALQASPDFPALPQAGKEVRLVEKYFPAGRRSVFTGAQATPSGFLSGKPEQFSYLHFATHGTASTLRPLESAVILSPEGDAFKLYARDIVQHPVHAYLVTISACNGAGMKTYAGEGLVGLAWAFLRAGAHNVIGGLWEVSNASTPQLMDELYKGLNAGKDPASALRNAKLSLVHSTGNYRRPYYWGPFQLYAGS